jgi:hypothetical protein
MAQNADRPKWQNFELITSVSLATLGVRIVVLEAYVDTNNGFVGCEIHPVVAIQSLIVSHYTRPTGSGDGRNPPASVTPQHLEKAGWTLEEISTQIDPIIATAEWGLSEAKFVCGFSNVAWHVVACPWMPEQDERLLERAIAKVKAEAIKKEQRRCALQRAE